MFSAVHASINDEGESFMLLEFVSNLLGALLGLIGL